MNKAYIALGSNIEPRKEYLNGAIDVLEEKSIRIKGVSSIYETAPVGYAEQSHFLNMVIEVETTLTAMELLNVCQQIEAQLGRKRTIKNGPRTADLDILLYNDEIIESERLLIPHPRMHERGFVLIPLFDLVENLIIPGRDVSIKELVENLSARERAEVVEWKER